MSKRAFLTRNLVVIALYFLTGRLALLLAVPPGFATAFWPPAGIALSAVLLAGPSILPAILIGSILLNASVGMWISGLTTWSNLTLALSIGLGATLQALVGGFLIRYSVGERLELDRTSKILKFLVLGGPVTSLINATVGVSALLLHGVISSKAATFTWCTWWSGDTIGSIVLTPIALAWLGEPRKFWRQRAKIMSLPLLAAFTLTIIAYRATNAKQQSRILTTFAAETEGVKEQLTKGFNSYRNVLHLMKGFVVAGEGRLTRPAFRAFSDGLMRLYPGVQSVSWNPVVMRNERAALETLAHKQGFPEFRFSQKSSLGRLTVADSRQEYVIVELIEPVKENRQHLGYDLLSDPMQMAAIERSKQLRDIASTQLANPQILMEDPSLTFYLPVFKRDLDPNIESGQDRVAGYLAARIQIPDMVNSILQGRVNPEDMAFQLEDAFQNVWLRIGALDPGSFLLSGSQSLTTSLGGMTWKITMAPTASYLLGSYSNESWFVLVGGLLFTGLISGLLLLLAGRNEALSREIDQRNVVESELRQAKDAAESANRAKSAFVANMSHEIRTPLGVVLGFSELLADNVQDKEERERAADAIRRNGELLCRIIDDILDLSKCEVGRFQIEPRPTSLSKLLSDLGMIFEPQAQNKKLIFSIERVGDLPDRILADGHRMRQILLNLISNALKFTEKGLIRLRVSSMPFGENEYTLVFEVEDTGIGISEAEQAKLFVPFSRAEGAQAQSFGGTGLGLALSRRLARLMGGDLLLKSSEPGVGSRFEVRLRVQKALGKTEEESQIDPMTNKNILKGKKVLLVEDLEDTRHLVSFFLRQAGLEVVFATNGLEAIEAYQAEKPDIILMDIRMPVLDGYEAVYQLRQMGAQVPIIALTAHSMIEERVRCLTSGFDGFLTKPLDLQQLREALLFHLGGKKKSQPKVNDDGAELHSV